MLDLLTIVVIIVFVFIGYKKGVAKTALTLGSSLLSLIISILFSKPIAESFYDSTIKPSLISKFDSAVKTAADGTLLSGNMSLCQLLYSSSLCSPHSSNKKIIADG